MKSLSVSCALAVALAATASAMEVSYDVLVPLTPENAILGHYSATKKPVATVKSGTVVRIDGGGGAGAGRRGADGKVTAEAVNAYLKENNIPTTVEECVALQETIKVLNETTNKLPPPPGAPAGTGGGGHMLVGPVYVEGAEPGDTLEVRILDVTPRIPFGTTGSSPGRGGLALGNTPPETLEAASAAAPLPGAGGGGAAAAPAAATGSTGTPRPSSKITILDLKRNAGIFNKDIEVPLGPFMGVMAVCPPDSEGPTRRSTAPGAFGGNLDCKELVAGSTLYLPVFQKGALFYTGDSHALQGDGEVTGTAIETADTCILQFIVHKGEKLAFPRAETPSDYISFGLHPDLNKAMQQAVAESVDFLKTKKNLDILQAYALSSICVNYRVTQVVDRVLGVHAMIPKKVFVTEGDTYWYRPH